MDNMEVGLETLLNITPASHTSKCQSGHIHANSLKDRIQVRLKLHYICTAIAKVQSLTA